MPIPPRYLILDAARRRALNPRAAWVVGLFVLLNACDRKGSGEVVLSGDVPGLDTLATRADILLAGPARSVFLEDSLRAATMAALPRQAEAALRAAPIATAPDPATATPNSAGREMSQRAYARAESLMRSGTGSVSANVGAGGAAQRDTVRGTLVMKGTAAAPQMVLLTRNGNTEVALSGMATSALSRMDGIEVVVRGVLVSPRDVVVSDYIVRGVKGVPAFDGVLSQADGAWSLALTDGSGKKRLATVPPTLRSAVGTRVWVSVQPGVDTPVGAGIVRR